MKLLHWVYLLTFWIGNGFAWFYIKMHKKCGPDLAQSSKPDGLSSVSGTHIQSQMLRCASVIPAALQWYAGGRQANHLEPRVQATLEHSAWEKQEDS